MNLHLISPKTEDFTLVVDFLRQFVKGLRAGAIYLAIAKTMVQTVFIVYCENTSISHRLTRTFCPADMAGQK